MYTQVYKLTLKYTDVLQYGVFLVNKTFQATL